MENGNVELGLLDPETQELVSYIMDLIPEQDHKGLSEDDVVYVLDKMDDYLEKIGLIEDDGEEVTYLDGEVDETEQMVFVQEAAKKDGRTISSEQIQLIMDGELQYGIEHGYYEEEE